MKTRSPTPLQPFLGYASTILAVSTIIFGFILSEGELYSQTLDVTRTPKDEYAMLDFESVAGWVVKCMGIVNYATLPLSFQELLSYDSPVPEKSDLTKFPDGVRQPYNEERVMLTPNKTLALRRDDYKIESIIQYKVWELQTIRPTPTPGASRGSGARAEKGR